MNQSFPRLAAALIVFALFSTLTINAQSWTWGLSDSMSAAATEHAYGFDAVTDNNNYIYSSAVFTGAFTIGSCSVPSGCVVFKADSMHNVLWAIGTQGVDFISKIATGSSDNVYMILNNFGDTATSFGPYTLYNDSGIDRKFLAKVSPSGSVLWVKKLTGDSLHFLPDNNNRLAVDQYDNVYVASTFDRPADTVGPFTLHNTSGNYSSDIYLAKFDSSGACLWAMSFDGSSSDYTVNIKVSPAGNIYFVGATYSPVISVGALTLTIPVAYPYPINFVARFDSSGTPIWMHLIDANNDVTNSAISQTENIYITGSSIDSIPGVGDDAGFITKYNSSGTLVWNDTILHGEAAAVTVDSHEFIWVSGYMEDSLNFSGEHLAAPNPFNSLYIAAFDHNGNYLPHTAAALPTLADYIYNIATDRQNNLYLPSFYGDTCTIGSSSLPTGTLPAGGGSYFYLARYSYHDIMTSEAVPVTPAPAPTLSVYPNPVTSTLTIQSSEEIAHITLTDITGHAISNYNTNEKEISLDVSTLPPGMYFVKVNDTEVRKFVKE